MFSCINEEGEGGKSVVEGYVYKVQHPDGEYIFKTDTIPAQEARVYIRYGNERPYSDDMRTGPDGYFKFKYLTKGTYHVFAYSEYQDGLKEEVEEKITVGRDETGRVKDIYVHEGKMYGKYYITGRVMAHYYKNGNMIGSTPAVDERVYIIKKDADVKQFFDDVRVSVNGYFVFEKLPVGEYQIYAVSEDENRILYVKEVHDVTIEEDKENNTVTMANDIIVFKRS